MLSLKKLTASFLLVLFALALSIPSIVFAQQDHTNIEYTDLNAFAEDLAAIRAKPNVQAVLYFTVFGSADTNFAGYALSDTALEQICGGRDCGTFGSNYGTYFKQGDYAKARDWGMDYTLEIVRERADKEAQNTAGVVANEGVANVIVRLGIASGGAPGFNPASGSRADIEAAATNYAAFLQSVSSKAGGKEFWAIAGPNEPDIETWAAPDCPSPPNGSDDPAKKQEYFDCTGEKLAWYMNKVIELAPGNVKLLSPAFNMTSFMFNDGGKGIPQSMKAKGANFAGLDAIAGNLYPAGQSMAKYWESQKVDEVLALLGGKPLIITETGFNAGGVAGTGPGYDLSMFDDFGNVSETDWYIHPIDGVGGDKIANTGESFASMKPAMRTHYIRDDLIRQGYEAHCASPGFSIQMTIAGKEWMTRFLESANSDKWPNQSLPGVILGGSGHIYDNIKLRGEKNPLTSRVEIDYKDAKTPIFRDVEGKRWLMSSLEEFFGFKDTVTGTENGGGSAEINSAAANSLLSRSQRCVQAASSLYQQHQMCLKLDDPDICTLYNREIPGTEYDIKQLLVELGAYNNKVKAARGLTSDNISVMCQTLMGADNTTLTETELKMRQAVEHMPLTIDRSYRFAFLVTNIRLRGGTNKTMFNFFTKPSGGSIPDVPQPKDEILVVAFKVPDITTNKGTITAEAAGSSPGVGTSESVPYYDASKLTRDSLLLKEQIKTTDQNGELYRDALFKKAKDTYDPRGANPRPQLESSDELFCSLIPDLDVLGTSGQNNIACRDPLGKALVDLINAQYLLNEDAAAYSQVSTDAPYDYKHAQLSACDPEVQHDPELGAQRPELMIVSEQATKVNDPAALHGEGGDVPEKLTNGQHVFGVEHGAAILENLMNMVSNMREQDGCGAGTMFDPSYGATEKAGCSGITPGNEGLKTMFSVIPQQMRDGGWPYSDPEDQIKVQQYLVYPEGYDLKMLEEVLAGTFFTSTQRETLDKEALGYDRIEISGDVNNFDGANESKEYDDNLNRSGKPWNSAPYECKKIDREPDGWDILGNVISTREVETAEHCTRTFGFSLDLVNPMESAQVLGAKLGYWIRSVQKTLHTISSVPRQYLEGCKSTEQFLLGTCGKDSTDIAGSADPPLQSGGMCGIDEVMITSNSTEFSIYAPDSSEALKAGDGYFVDPSSRYSLSLATRYLDGASMVLLNQIVPMNPNTCDAYQNTMVEIWYFPENHNFYDKDGAKDHTTDFGYWEKYSYKLKLNSNAKLAAVFDMKVKPGYYYFKINKTPCIMGNDVWVTESGQKLETGDMNRIIYIGENNTNDADAIVEKAHYCAKISVQTSMDGGASQDQQESNVGIEPEQCTLSKPYPVWANNSCGGRGGNSGDEDDGDFWKNADLPGANTYKEMMGFEFKVPNSEFQCKDLFPNVIREYNCAGATIDNSDIPSSNPGSGTTYNTGISITDIPYEGTTPLPAVGFATGYGFDLMDQVLNNRLYTWRQINSDVYNLRTCEINVGYVPSVSNSADAIVKAKEMATAMNNGSNAGNGAYVGCAAMLRLGDVPFYPNTGKAPRTVWVTDMQTGLTQGPILIIDVARKRHAETVIQTEHQGRWLIDLDHNTLDRFGHGFTKIEVKVCDTPNCSK